MCDDRVIITIIMIVEMQRINVFSGSRKTSLIFLRENVDNHSGGLSAFAINKSDFSSEEKNPSLWNAAFIQDL